MALHPALQAEVRAGRVVAERRAVTAREHRGDEARLQRQRLIPDAVDAAMAAMQASVSHADGDGPVAQPDRPQLPDRHLTVLLHRERRHLRVQGWDVLMAHRCTRTSHPRIVAPIASRNTMRS
jgi:hypothetical protein